jgi:hypothetical protein
LDIGQGWKSGATLGQWAVSAALLVVLEAGGAVGEVARLFEQQQGAPHYRGTGQGHRRNGVQRDATHHFRSALHTDRILLSKILQSCY